VPTIYSHSRLSNFENCPKKFHFRYILKTPVETEGIEAFVGKRVHEVLERLYLFVGRGMVPPLEKVIQRYRALWDEHYDAERVRVVRRETPVSFYVQLGERCLQNYYRRYYPFDADETLGLEERVVIQVGRHQLQGIIDRIVRTRDGVIEIHDYKTGGYIPSQKKLDKDRQLALYQIGVADRYGREHPYRLVWHYVASGQVRSSTRTPEQLGELLEHTISLIDRIERESEFSPRKTRLCDWCEYLEICPLWQSQAPSSTSSIRSTPPPV
jgi:putative RecB family exonuclease